jgi:hypothetical protein
VIQKLTCMFPDLAAGQGNAGADGEAFTFLLLFSDAYVCDFSDAGCTRSIDMRLLLGRA